MLINQARSLGLLDRFLLAIERVCRWIVRHQTPRWSVVTLLRNPAFLRSRPYYFLSRLRANSIRRQVPSRPPACLYVETTNHCNAKCVICSHPFMARVKQTMAREIFEKAIDQAAMLGIERVQLNATGEPLLDKQMPARIAYAKSKGIGYVGIFSNASILTAERGEQLLGSGLDLIVLSLDGLTAAEFERTRPPLKFADVYDNIVRFCLQKRTSGKSKPEIRIQITPIDQDQATIRETDAFRELTELADRVMFTPPAFIHDWTGNVPAAAAASIADRPSTATLPCSRLYNTMTVLSDGRVPVCSLDYEGRFELGDLRKKDLGAIWRNDAFAAARSAHESSRVSTLPVCSTCTYRPSWLEWY